MIAMFIEWISSCPRRAFRQRVEQLRQRGDAQTIDLAVISIERVVEDRRYAGVARAADVDQEKNRERSWGIPNDG
jgi:hypothetical protein